jgi:hypothetical protein
MARRVKVWNQVPGTLLPSGARAQDAHAGPLIY